MMKTKTFDAVAKSRRWKEAVSHETEHMSCEQVLAFFNKDRVIATLGMIRDVDDSFGSHEDTKPLRITALGAIHGADGPA